ncbi:MAG: hypothetical protein ACI97N_002741 [Cognaticolwellia sp.]
MHCKREIIVSSRESSYKNGDVSGVTVFDCPLF